ncbi:regulatory protein [Mycobacteroides abscessus subsp. abscessus]|nr:regulatory protein [Mycobacteroides abscessus subsp. abscessus]
MKLKIDTSAVSWMCTKSAEARIDFESGHPKIDKGTGLPLYAVQLMALDTDGAEILAVTVAGEPKVTVGQSVTVSNLVALPWNQNGKNGIAYRADAITVADAKAVPPRS